MVADESSRELSKDTEWSLDCHVFHENCFIFGKSHIDCFASRLYNKLPKYVFSHLILQHGQLMLSI